MQKKSETFSKFCEFKELVEKESGKQVKERIGGEGVWEASEGSVER